MTGTYYVIRSNLISRHPQSGAHTWLLCMSAIRMHRGCVKTRSFAERGAASRIECFAQSVERRCALSAGLAAAAIDLSTVV